MMLIYKGRGARFIPRCSAHPQIAVTPGVPVDIPDDLAPGLLARPDWRKAPVPKPPEKKEA